MLLRSGRAGGCPTRPPSPVLTGRSCTVRRRSAPSSRRSTSAFGQTSSRRSRAGRRRRSCLAGSTPGSSPPSCRPMRSRRSSARGRCPPLADRPSRSMRWPRASSRCGCRRARRSSSSSLRRRWKRFVGGSFRAASPRRGSSGSGPVSPASSSARPAPFLGRPSTATSSGTPISSWSIRATPRTPPADAILAAVAATGGRLIAIALTHVDPDHAAGAEALAIRLDLPIFAGPGAGRDPVVPRPRAGRRRADRCRRRRAGGRCDARATSGPRRLRPSSRCRGARRARRRSRGRPSRPGDPRLAG